MATSPLNPPGAPPASAGSPPAGTTAGSGDGGLVDAAKQQAGELADVVQDKVQNSLDQQKQRATETLGGVTDALRKVGGTLRESDQDAFARYAETAAEQLDALTRSLRNRSVGELLDEAERFARRDPALFIGGAFLVGVFGARFLKASAPNRFDPATRYASGYGPRGQGPSGYGAGRPGVGAYTGYRGYGEGQPRRAPMVANTPGAEMPNPSNPAPKPTS